jgi:hypothetical protein
MNAQQLFTYSHCFQDSENKELFLPYKYVFDKVKSTFYQSLKYLDDKNLFRPKEYPSGYNMLPDYRFYDYIPFDRHDQWDEWGHFSYDVIPASIKILKETKQYHISVVYNIDSNTTIGEVKERILIPLLDKLYNHPNTLTTLLFINRLSNEQVLFELFLFCSEEIEGEVIDNFFAKEARADELVYALLTPLNYDYFHYRFYLEVFHNSNVITQSSAILSCVLKPYSHFSKDTYLEADNSLRGEEPFLYYYFNTVLPERFPD